MRRELASLRIGPEEREVLERGAALLGLPWTTALRRVGVRAMREVIAETALGTSRAEREAPAPEPAERTGEDHAEREDDS